MKIYIWQISWAGNILDGTPVYGWSPHEEDIPFVTSADINFSRCESGVGEDFLFQLDTLRFVQEHIVWDIPKLRFEAHQYNCDFDDAVVEYAKERDFYKHD